MKYESDSFLYFEGYVDSALKNLVGVKPGLEEGYYLTTFFFLFF